VSPATSAEAARTEIARFGLDWTSVVEDGQLLGWVDPTALDGVASVAEATPLRFSAAVTPKSSLRQALDSIVTSQTNVAVVLDDGQRYLGILTLEHVSKEIIS